MKITKIQIIRTITIQGILLLALFIVPIAVRPVLANGSTEFQPITRIHPRTLNTGEAGTFISNCGGGGTQGCILTPACAASYAFWIPVSHPLYKTIVSTAMLSLATGRMVELRGSGACNEPGGHEILEAVDFRTPSN